MPRMPRINIENALYYVTSRGDNSQDIFKEPSDYMAYIELLKRYKEQYNYRLFAYGLLPNHLHLLIELVKDVTTSQIMHSLNSSYIKYFNGKYKKSGHLLQERCGMVLAEKEPNLLNLTAYIHLNPKALGLAGDIAGYQYTSYPSYLYYSGNTSAGKEPPVDIKEEAKEVMKKLKNVSYKAFIDGLPAEDIKALGRELGKKSILGSDDFIEKVKARVESEKDKINKDSQYKGVTKKLIIGSSVLLLALSFLTIFLYQRSAHMKDMMNKEMVKNELELNRKLGQEKQLIRKDLDEKYRADMISYQALSKRLEIEKQKVKSLEPEAAKSGK